MPHNDWPVWWIMRVECYAATKPQQGKSANEDAFLIGHDQTPFAVLCDGAGNAQPAAKRVLTLFERLLHEASADQILTDATWANWVKLLNSALLGGNQCRRSWDMNCSHVLKNREPMLSRMS